jgi:hypothetical protein
MYERKNSPNLAALSLLRSNIFDDFYPLSAKRISKFLQNFRKPKT